MDSVQVRVGVKLICKIHLHLNSKYFTSLIHFWVRVFTSILEYGYKRSRHPVVMKSVCQLTNVCEYVQF